MSLPFVHNTEQSWFSQKMYIVYDPNYTKEAPSDICTHCKAIRFYDRISQYPHLKKCPLKATDNFDGYVIGPCLGKGYVEDKNLFADIKKQVEKAFPSSLRQFGPYTNKQIFPLKG